MSTLTGPFVVRNSAGTAVFTVATDGTITATGAIAGLTNVAGTAGTAAASKIPVLGASYNLDQLLVTTFTSDGTITQSKTITGTALGTVRGIHGQVTASTAAIASGSIVGVRGICTLSGTITAGQAFLYGAQGKLVVTGTMNHADARLCGLLAQLDTTGATLTAGQLSALWVDMGAGVTGAGGGQFNMVRISNTVVGSKPNAMVYMYGDASFAFDLAGGPGGTCSYVVAAGSSSGSFGNADGVASKVIVVSIGGVTYYIPAHTQNT